MRDTIILAVILFVSAFAIGQAVADGPPPVPPPLTTNKLTMVDGPKKPYPTIEFKADGQYIAHINAHMFSKAGTRHDHMEIYTRCGPMRDDADGGTDCPRLGIDAGHDVAPVFITEHALLRIRHERGISMKGENGKYYRLRINKEGQLYITPDKYFPKAGTLATVDQAK